MRSFRQLLIALILIGSMALAVATETRAAEPAPQRAVVTSPGAPVRSGPGDAYYLTDTLPEDTAVEVYRREPDGWCAIRPPAESFSWVFAQHVRLIDDGLAETTKADVAARVGSRLSAQRDVVQVRMKEGEQVAVLGRDERDGGLWYKIAPPAGEFRWIHAKDIGLGGEVHVDPEANAVKTVSMEEPVDGKSAGLSAPPLANHVAPPAPLPTNNQWTPAKSAPPTGDITPIGAAPASSAELAEHLQELELRLSRMVAEPPTTWNIAPLEQAAEQLLSRADSVSDRAAVKAALDKIDRFSSIQRRYTNSNLATTITPLPSTGGASGTVSPTTAGANTTNSPYDAVGILRPVVSRRPGAPQFALVNAQGQVVTFVTPSPDVNLQPYIGQQIGVTGSRGYIPEFRRAHVTAGRVSPLNERMIR